MTHEFQGVEYGDHANFWEKARWIAVSILGLNGPDKKGYQVGTYGKIGPTDPSRASEYVPIVYEEGQKPQMVHKSRVRR